VQQAAMGRWMELAQQAAQKMAPPPQPMGGPGDAPDLGTAQPTGLLPGPIAAAPISAQPQTIADMASATFEETAPQ
jgi:hypothetical protein